MDELDATVSTLRESVSGPHDEQEEEEQAAEDVKKKMDEKTRKKYEAKLEKVHVYSEGDEVYNVTLNQTNIEHNNNKFYRIQLLEDAGSRSYSVKTEWGRVGKKGQYSIMECGEGLPEAKDVFKKRFYEKTKNKWEDRENFEKVDGKYDLVFIEHNTNKKEEYQITVDAAPKKKPFKLDVKTQSLLELICDLKAMEEDVQKMKFDVKKTPLGKLTSEQIDAGNEALKSIEECLKRKATNQELLEASNRFYTRIPHDFGRKRPPVIETEKELKHEIHLLEVLRDIQIAVQIVQSSEYCLLRQYHLLQCDLQPLDSSSDEYELIENYLQTTNDSTDFTMTVIDIFSVDKQGEIDNFRSDLPNRTLLWHGSRLSNWVSILSQGLQVAPPGVLKTGSKFGKGIYFAEMSSKSAKYCYAKKDSPEGLLLVCEG